MILSPNPVFIIGNPRSGTTLLRLILNAHSKIVIPPEAGFAFWLYPKYKDFSFIDLNAFLNEMKTTKKIKNWNLDWDKLQNHLIQIQPKDYSSLIDNIYRYYARTTGKNISMWGDKNNFYLNHIEEIKKVFPKAYFIHIIRDGRNVACSYKKLNKKQIISEDAPDLPDKTESIAYQWKSNIQKIRSSFENFNYQNVLEIRLEDLTVDPTGKINQIMNLIGEDFEPQMLEYHKSFEINKTIPKDYLQWKLKNTMPIQNESKDLYKSKLTEEQLLKFNAIAGDILTLYRYGL